MNKCLIIKKLFLFSCLFPHKLLHGENALDKCTFKYLNW